MSSKVKMMTKSKKLKRPKKPKPEKIDGLSRADVKKLRAAIRQVWSWSYPRRLAITRAIGADGFPRCELCKRKVPKVYADHIEACGSVLQPGYLYRVFCPSTELQALCKKCHDQKTRAERKFEAAIDEIDSYLSNS